MLTVKFNCETMMGSAGVAAYVNGVKCYDYYLYEDEATYRDSIEFLDAKGEMLSRLGDVVAEMVNAIRHAKRELNIEREAYDA